ncbi:MAG: hypothetical protein GF384_07735 [Elusimicrobia bacterium]|nr:hypothetical protein [Elusimicrobiota bacterium]
MRKLMVCIVSIAVFTQHPFGMGRKKPASIRDGITTNGVLLHLTSDQETYARFDSILFSVTMYNERTTTIESEKIFSDYVEPSSIVSLIAVDEQGNRYSGHAGNRTDPGDDFTHYSIQVLPNKTIQFNFYHRELTKPVTPADEPLALMSDRIGPYTVHAEISSEFLSSDKPLLSNTIQLSIHK